MGFLLHMSGERGGTETNRRKFWALSIDPGKVTPLHLPYFTVPCESTPEVWLVRDRVIAVADPQPSWL